MAKTPDAPYRFETLALHAGHTPDRDTHSRAVPIHQTTSFTFEDAAAGARRFGLEEEGYLYTRLGNPTTAVLEARVAALEGGVGALATASGQAAVALALTTLLGAGHHLVSGAELYGGTYTLFRNTLARFGLETSFVPVARPEAFRAAIRPETRAVYVEALGNPSLELPDLEALAEVAHGAGLPLVVDATLASPWLLQPLDHGADIVVHSATKYLGGHGTSLGGLIVDGGSFDWTRGPFPELAEPDPAYGGLRFTERFGRGAFIAKARLAGLRDLGPALSPFNAFLLLQGIETLPLRVERHGRNALELARRLRAHPAVAWVGYPGLEEHPGHARATRLFRPGAGYGCLLTFGVKGGLEAGRAVIDRVRLFSRLANVCDAKSLILHPASTTHHQMNPGARRAAGVPDDLIRVSVGLEHVEDLWADLEQALEVRP